MTRFSASTLTRDFASSIVVFLVAVPLCLGISIASGVPVAMGLISGIIGGIVVGLLSGSPLQVSGPAAGLAVIVFSFVSKYGVAMLGPVLVLAGIIQILAGTLRVGSWFRAISPAVVHGMLAGIGILIILGQVHVLMDAKPAASGIANVVAFGGSIERLWTGPSHAPLLTLAVGLASLVAMLGWEKLRPASLSLVPGALAGVTVGTALTAVFNLPIARVQLPDSIFDAFALPSLANFSRLAEPGILLAAVVIAVIASAETLLSAAAVDRMHDGPRSRFNKELFAQGIGNSLSGIIGGLPITGVIVRSSANVQAGARTRMSAIMHGIWMLSLIALAPALLKMVPLTALAAVLLVTGWRLISLHHVRSLRDNHGWVPVGIWAATLTMVVVEDLLMGVALGLALSIIEIVPYIRRRLHIRQSAEGETVNVRLAGVATCKDVPALLKTLENLPDGHDIRLGLTGLRYSDHTWAETISEWIRREKRTGRRMEILLPSREPSQRMQPLFNRIAAEAA